MKLDNFSMENRLYAITVVVVIIFLTTQFTLLRWSSRLSVNLDEEPVKKTAKLVPFDGKRFYRERNYPFRIPLVKTCSSTETPFLIIFVASAPGHRDRRDAIRATWGSASELSKNSAYLFFVLGTPQNDNPNLESGIAEEISSYRDILQVDFVDSYLNLTLKSISAIRWTLESCPGADYFMKTDDDIYVNLGNLKSYFEAKKDEKRIFGCIKTHAMGQPMKRLKDGSMSNDHAFAGGHPVFVAGAGYVISGGLLAPLYQAMKTLPLYPIEDVFVTGRCGQFIGQRPFHDGRFSCGEALANDCDMSARFTGHWVKPDRQRAIHAKLNDRKCSNND